MTPAESAFWAAALAGHGALWVEIVNRVHGLGWRRQVIDAATAACGLCVTAIPAWGAWTLRGASESVAAADPLGVYGWACVVVLAVVVASRVGFRWDPQRDRRTRKTATRRIDTRAALGTGAVGGPRMARLAALPGNRLLQVDAEELLAPIDRLPAGLAGLRVAHLTDLHLCGRLSIDYFREVARAVNEWSPDVVCITGDVVERSEQLPWIEPLFGGLRAPAGRYFVLGNHDLKVDSDEVRRRMVAVGFVDVGGRCVEAAHRGTPFVVCGDERPWFPGYTAPPVDGRFVLGLAHTPDRFGWGGAAGIDLLLAGHNHGGQVCFPLIGPLLCPSRHGVRYAAGTFRRGGSVMHVGRGTGSLFPLRYGCPPEVTLLTLTRG